MKTRSFGKNGKDQEATLYIFENAKGMVMEVTDFGATLYALRIPSGGKMVDVVLGYDDPLGYEGPGGTFFGQTVGRNANRTGGAHFELGGKTYHLDANNGRNNLHSGLDFYSFRIWQVEKVTDQAITFALHSPDGDQGFPGALAVKVTYTLTDDNALHIDYEGISDADTVFNLTNHSYFNLNGHDSGSILDHNLWLDADAFTPADAESIPTGQILPVEGTPMDFRTPKKVGRDIDADYEALNFGHGYDHNWCLNNPGRFRKVAGLKADLTDICMEVYTDLPGVQIYTGNFIDKEAGKDGAVYERRQGICFETQVYPDALNKPDFPSAVIKAGEKAETRTVYQFL